jgi:hypothetical protein
VRYVITYKSSTRGESSATRTVKVELVNTSTGGSLQVVDAHGKTIPAKVIGLRRRSDSSPARLGQRGRRSLAHEKRLLGIQRVSMDLSPHVPWFNATWMNLHIKEILAVASSDCDGPEVDILPMRADCTRPTDHGLTPTRPASAARVQFADASEVQCFSVLLSDCAIGGQRQE